MRRRLTTRGKVVLSYFGVLVVAVVVGVLISGGTGKTITAIAAAILAISLVATFGIGKAAEDAVDRRGRRRY